jgi:hypothetical protein
MSAIADYTGPTITSMSSPSQYSSLFAFSPSVSNTHPNGGNNGVSLTSVDSAGAEGSSLFSFSSPPSSARLGRATAPPGFADSTSQQPSQSPVPFPRAASSNALALPSSPYDTVGGPLALGRATSNPLPNNNGIVTTSLASPISSSAAPSTVIPLSTAATTATVSLCRCSSPMLAAQPIMPDVTPQRAAAAAICSRCGLRIFAAATPTLRSALPVLLDTTPFRLPESMTIPSSLPSPLSSTTPSLSSISSVVSHGHDNSSKSFTTMMTDTERRLAILEGRLMLESSYTIPAKTTINSSLVNTSSTGGSLEQRIIAAEAKASLLELMWIEETRQRLEWTNGIDARLRQVERRAAMIPPPPSLSPSATLTLSHSDPSSSVLPSSVTTIGTSTSSSGSNGIISSMSTTTTSSIAGGSGVGNGPPGLTRPSSSGKRSAVTRPIGSR